MGGGVGGGGAGGFLDIRPPLKLRVFGGVCVFVHGLMMTKLNAHKVLNPENSTRRTLENLTPLNQSLNPKLHPQT